MPDPIRTIVAGVSHPAEDDLTLAAAAELARWTGAELHLVHAFGVPPLMAPPELGFVTPEWAEQYTADLRARLEAVRRPVRRPLQRVLLTTDLSEPSATAHEEGLDTVASLFGPPRAVPRSGRARASAEEPAGAAAAALPA